ncbi:unnamed protein product [Boreogadus saida]
MPPSVSANHMTATSAWPEHSIFSAHFALLFGKRKKRLLSGLDLSLVHLTGVQPQHGVWEWQSRSKCNFRVCLVSSQEGKKRFTSPAPCVVKRTDFNMYVLSGPSQFTPKGSEELEHAHAGLGKRILSIPDNLIHSEIVALLEGEFPKLKTLKGGWMFYKATGGSGRRKLSIIPTESEGYSTRLLKSASNNGKNTMFIVPLQELLSTEPLPYDSAEFAMMPQSSCITCGSQMPWQLLPLHVEGCNGTLIVSCYSNVSPTNEHVIL